MVKRSGKPAKGRWRDKASYEYTLSLPPAAWAWEFLRRNPELRQVVLEIVPPEREASPSPLRTVSIPRPSFELEKWGLLYFDDLDRTADEALVFWRREICPAVLPVWAIEAGATVGMAQFNLSRPDCEAWVLRADDADHVLLRRAGSTVQLIWHGADIRNGDLLITAPVELLALMSESQRLAIQRLADFQTRGRLSLFKPNARAARLQMCLQALDGRIAGASWRQLASAIFGKERATKEWASPSRSLLDRTRRLFWRGFSYMKGQYRDLLK